jgi:threonine dehydrogenase-like Zn-dependent dehydrogenase
MLSDILPTGFEIGVQYGGVKPGDVVAVVGAGPVGLSVISTAGLYGASRIIAIDLDANRVQEAQEFGATDGVDPSAANWKDQVLALTDGWGVDVAVEAVGVPETFQMCTQIVCRRGAGQGQRGACARFVNRRDGPIGFGQEHTLEPRGGLGQPHLWHDRARRHGSDAACTAADEVCADKISSTQTKSGR